MNQIPRDFSTQVSYASGRGQLSGEAYQAIYRRLAVLKVVCCLMALTIVFRLLGLQVINFSTWQEWATKQHLAKVQVASERGPIMDRNGKLLAVSVPASSIFIRPREINKPYDVAQKLSGLLDISEASILEKLQKNPPLFGSRGRFPAN